MRGPAEFGAGPRCPWTQPSDSVSPRPTVPLRVSPDPSHPWAATRKAGKKVSAASGVPKIRTGISEPGVGRERSAA